jgi:hypothetical protein
LGRICGAVTSEFVERNEIAVGIRWRLRARGGGFDIRRRAACTRGSRWLTRTRNHWSNILGLLNFRLEAEEDGPDRQFIARIKSCFFDQPAIDTNAIPAAQVPNQDAVISHGHAAMPSGDLLRVDADVTLEMSADQEDRSMQGDLRGGSRDQGDESE